MLSDWNELVAEGIAARKELEGAQWHLGDLARKVEIRHGEKSLARYAEEIGVKYDTLSEYRRVATKFASGPEIDPSTPTTFVRHPSLSFSHHKEVTPYDDADKWLDKAEEEGWSKRELRANVEQAVHDRDKAFRQKETEETPVVIVTQRCPKCGFEGSVEQFEIHSQSFIKGRI